MSEEARLHIDNKRIIAWISPDGSGGRLLQRLAGLSAFGENDDIYNMVVSEYSDILKRKMQYVPDDIVCYSNLTVGQFLHGAAMGLDDADKAESEAVRLIELFEIDQNEQLLDMTFEQNRLVTMIQALMIKPELLLLNMPHDMIGEKRYDLLITEFAKMYKQGGDIMVAADAYDNIILPCEQYIYIRNGQVVANYLREELILPAKVVTITGGNLGWMRKDKRKILWQNKNRACFIYKEDNMQELTVRLLKSGCKDFKVEDITREELIFENYERWSL